MERRHTESASFAARHSQLLDRVSGARGLVVVRDGPLLLLMWPGVVMVEDSPAQQQRHTAGFVCHTFTFTILLIFFGFHKIFLFLDIHKIFVCYSHGVGDVKV